MHINNYQRNLILLLAVFLVVSGVFFGVMQKSKVSAEGSTSGISLQAKDWDVLYSKGLHRHPYDLQGAGWYFNFPVATQQEVIDCQTKNFCPNVEYVTTKYTTPVTGNYLAMTLQVATTGNPMFNYVLEPTNTCVYPAHVRLFFERSGDKFTSNYEFYRWWSNPISYELSAGSITLTVPITPDQWSSVNGKFGNTDASSLAGFQQALANIGSVGMTFGGGCFFGHGVNVSGGTAQFIVTDFKIY